MKSRVQPLSRHNGADWVEALAKQVPGNADVVPGYFQYRYGNETIKFIQHVFPEQFPHLQCPVNFRETAICPYIFANLCEFEDWEFADSQEVRRSSTLFSYCLYVVALEMVLAYSRGCPEGRCQILVMWCLKTPLHELLSFLDAFVGDACGHVHTLWGIAEPPEGSALAYSLTAWMQSGRFQCKAAQNAHGSDVDVSLWFLVRRQKLDAGLRGEQTHSAFVFEQSTRATLRQHIFVEDLRSEEVLPDYEPYWSAGWDLGLRDAEQYSSNANESVAKRTLLTLRVFEYVEDLLVRCHGFLAQEVWQYRFNPCATTLLPVFLGSPQCQRIFFSESVAAKRLFNRTDDNRMKTFLKECWKCYEAMYWPEEEQE